MHELSDDLILTHYGESPGDMYGAVSPPVFLTSLHVFDSIEDYNDSQEGITQKFFYGRDGLGNPTTTVVESKLAALERGAKALMFASGMAATSTAIMTLCKSGCHIIAMNNLYGPVKSFLDNICIPNLNMSVTYVKGTDISEFEAAVKPNTSLILLESPSTFVFSIVNLRAVVQLAKKHGIKTMIDNTYCTPLYQKPLEMGIDVSMHTASKYLGGHSDVIGGALVSKDEELMKRISRGTRAWFGGVIGPMEAWLVMRGMRTLSARLAVHSDTALSVAEYLEGHDRVKHVYYPGLRSHPQYELMRTQQTGNTGLMSFELDADVETTIKFADKLKHFLIGCSWGGYESLVIMPLMRLPEPEFERIGAGRNLVRIYCGLEGKELLISDLEQALKSL